MIVKPKKEEVDRIEFDDDELVSDEYWEKLDLFIAEKQSYLPEELNDPDIDYIF